MKAAEWEEAFHAKEREVAELHQFIHAQSNTIEALKQRVVDLNFEVINQMASRIATAQVEVPDTIEELDGEAAS